MKVKGFSHLYLLTILKEIFLKRQNSLHEMFFRNRRVTANLLTFDLFRLP